MSSSKAFTIYSHLPIYLQNLACSAAGLKMRCTRYNRTFKKVLEFLRESQWWPVEKQREYQNLELRRVVDHAYETVPYYREIFGSRNLEPGDIQSAEDLAKLPVLDKPTLRSRFADLQSQVWPSRRIRHGHTGGTTGTSLHLLSDRDIQPWQWGVWWRHRERSNLKLHDPFIVFGGRNVVPLNSMEPPFWRRNLPMHQTYVSIHHMTEANMPALVDYLQTREVEYYSGYPSSLYILASWLLKNKTKLRNPPRIVATGAETLLPHQRAAIAQALECEVTDQYGASEHCGNISECEHHNYHVDMEFGIIEFLPIDGMPENVRRIVCTGLHNPAMPLIRYDIGDVAVLKEGTCPCGREAPMVERIDGRIESYILTPDGRQMGRLDFLFKETQNILEAQLIQYDVSSVQIKIVPAPDYNEESEKQLRQLARKYLGDAIGIEFKYVGEIPREPNGKFRQIVSAVFKDKFAGTNE